MDLLCALLVAAFGMMYPLITRQVINVYVPNHDLRMILVCAAGLLGIYLSRTGLMYFIHYYGHIVGVRITLDIRKEAFDHLQRLPFSYFDRTKSGTIMSRIINDTFEIAELAHHGPEDVFISVVTLIGSFIILANTCLPMTLIIFALLPFLVWFAMTKRLQLAKTSMNARIQIGEVNSDLENSISGVRVSKAYEASFHEIEKFRVGSESYATFRGKQFRAMAVFSSGTGLIMDLLTLVTLVSGAIFTLNGYINLGDYTAFLLFTGLYTDPLKRLINFVEQLQTGMTGFVRVQELLKVEPELEDTGSVELENVVGDIVFENITFRYDESKKVLSDLSLSIKAGSTVALVGPSGSGKSTLCHLLPRFYDLESGRILLDGADIQHYTRFSLRRKIGIVQQDTYLFSGSIKDNIAYGNFDASDEEIIEAAKNANIHEFISTLPDQYDTYVGERGVMLSGGQKQRISIARIFLKNPPILILDEATSALDTTTEHTIQHAFDELSAGRTTLVVAHRLTTIQHADEIIVITDSGIAERGDHEGLLQKGGLYADRQYRVSRPVAEIVAIDYRDIISVPKAR